MASNFSELTSAVPLDSSVTDNNTRDSPPQTPPSPDATDAEIKLSRKREREVSQEPVASPRNKIDDELLPKDHREFSTPAKKNRTHLDSTQEEDDVPGSRSPSQSPPLSTSPRQEMKINVRQISQGVEDLSWRNMKAVTPEREVEMDPEIRESYDDSATNTLQPAIELTSDYGACSYSNTNDESPPEFVAAGQQVEATTPPDTQLSTKDSVSQLPRDASSSRGSDSDSAEDAKGVKRKFLERGTSQGPQENGDLSTGVEPLKRPRDDADADDNPREAKRPSPPPEANSEGKKAIPQLSGFMAYAAPTSPFSAVKGKNIFASSKPSSSSIFSSTSSTSFSFTTASGEASSSTTSTPTATKRSGFEAFASSTSPFTSATRSKSPVLGSASKLARNKSPSRRTNQANVSAFSAYATGGMQGFAVPVPKRPRAGSPGGDSSRSSLERTSTLNSFGPDSGAEEEDEKPSTFGEKLRAGRDDDDDNRSEEEQKPFLTEQDFMTGEEDEETIHQVRGKLFTLADTNQWKERGTGVLKLNVRRSDGGGARLVMRKEAVYTVLLNVTLFHGMRCALAQDPRYLRFSVIEGGITTHYNLRLANAKIAQELMEEINTNIPSA